ncbi:cell division protein DedD [Motilimonas eburnea]|uniref:cell division protein DedD n=1 Tax=Motilimonas eburnea TaxID=1737488 RepID=UPI001E339F48|nr:cell division protein DedD [Motilimonas eburnea]
MATQFQNRLVGTIILVALAVLFLPSLLDGQKETYREEFVAIPIAPEMVEQSPQQALQVPADVTEQDTQFSIETIPDAVIISAKDPAAQSTEAESSQEMPVEVAAKEAPSATPEPMSEPSAAPIKVVTAKPVEVIKATPAPVVKVADKPKATPKPTPKPIDVAKAAPKPTPEPLKAGVIKPVAPVTKVAFKDAAWTIQLGAFRNAANVKALVKKLRQAGHPVYTIPAVVTETGINKVYVGPDVSAQKLEKQLPALKQLTKLNGRVVAYNPQ